MNYRRHNCRLCGGVLKPRLTLAPTPAANAFTSQPNANAKRYDLDLNQCDDCNHVQLGYILDGELLYTGYRYETPTAMIPHLERYAKELTKHKAEAVLEIGSNTGLNASILRRYFETVFEIDPGGTSQLCMTKPFNSTTAKMYIGVDLIVANHVFAHIDELNDVFDGVRYCLSPTGALVFEVQYFPSLVAAGAFDMIYHEHRDYHKLAPLRRFARRHGLVMTDWDFNYVQGGSIRVTMKKQGRECSIPTETIEWEKFKAGIDRRVKTVREVMTEAVFGAPAKLCTLLHHCGVADRVKYCVDDTKTKQGRYVPGTDIPIYPVSKLYEDKPEKVFLSAWNYHDVIKKLHPFNFITPNHLGEHHACV